MMTDFRALCAELTAWAEKTSAHYFQPPDVLLRARAALADEPAVPEGREPASVTGQPSDQELLDIAASTIEPYECSGITTDEYEPETECAVEAYGSELIAFARAVLARWGNHVPTPPADVSQLSDGYHTFAELYEHRHSLMLALMRALPRICWFSRRHADGELPFGSDDWFIVGAELPGAPITYHLPAAIYSLAQKTGALELPAGRPWDGHSAADVVHRLRDWAIAPTPPADGEVAELVEMLKGIAYWRRHGKPGEPAPTSFDIRQADRLDRAAELLERQASPACVVLKPSPELIEAFQDALPGRIEPLLEERHPAPVPVGERLPLPEVGE